MSLVRLQNVSKSYDDAPVLRDVYFRLSKGDRVGLIGRNGTGKTTVLKLILGQEELTEGEIQVDDGLSIGYFSQFSELDEDTPIVEILDGLFGEIHAVEAELLEIDAALGAQPDPAELDRLLHQQAALLEEMDRHEGWTYPVRIDTVLTRLGFSSLDRQRSVGQLSGGWHNRAALS